MKDQFHPLTVAKVRRETADAISYALHVPPNLRTAFKFRAGQHLVVRKLFEGIEVRRTYSISSGPADTDLWITIKRVNGGLFSPDAHDALIAGSTIEAMAPAGRFVSAPDETGARTYLAIAAGSGITPVMAIIQYALANERDSRFTLIYGNRSYESIIFRQALEDLKDQYLDRLQIFHILSRERDTDVPVLAGRIDREKIKQLMPSVGKLSEIDQVFLCGPDSLIKDARTELMTLGVAPERIKFEYFRAGPETLPRPISSEPSAISIDRIGAEVVAVLDGTRHRFMVEPGQHIVAAALKAGIRVPYSCKGGMCCTCRAKLVEGQVVMDRNFSLEPWEMDAGFVLTCQARPTTGKVVVDYDQM